MVSQLNCETSLLKMCQGTQTTSWNTIIRNAASPTDTDKVSPLQNEPTSRQQVLLSLPPLSRGGANNHQSLVESSSFSTVSPKLTKRGNIALHFLALSKHLPLNSTSFWTPPLPLPPELLLSHSPVIFSGRASRPLPALLIRHLSTCHWLTEASARPQDSPMERGVAAGEKIRGEAECGEQSALPHLLRQPD